MNSYHVITISHKALLTIALNIWRQDLYPIILQPIWFGRSWCCCLWSALYSTHLSTHSLTAVPEHCEQSEAQMQYWCNGLKLQLSSSSKAEKNRMEWTTKASSTPLQLACCLYIKFMKKQIPSKDTTRSYKILSWQTTTTIWQQQKQQQVYLNSFSCWNCCTSCFFNSELSNKLQSTKKIQIIYQSWDYHVDVVLTWQGLSCSISFLFSPVLRCKSQFCTLSHN